MVRVFVKSVRSEGLRVLFHSAGPESSFQEEGRNRHTGSNSVQGRVSGLMGRYVTSSTERTEEYKIFVEMFSVLLYLKGPRDSC